MIKTDCPSCKTPLMAPDSYAGKKPLCPVCKAKVPAVAPPSRRTQPKKAAPVPKAKQLVDELLEDAKKAPAAAAGAAPRPVKRAKPEKPPEEVPLAAARRRMPRKAVIAFAAGVLIVLGAAAYAVHYVVGRIHEQNRERVVLELDSLMGGVEEDRVAARKSLDEGMAAVKKEDYDVARKSFLAAIGAYKGLHEDVGSLRTRVAGWVREYPDAQAFADAREKLDVISDEVTKALGSKALTKGPELGKTLVIFEGEWITPEKKQQLYERRMKDLGNVFYEGEWITMDEMRRRQGMVQYEGKWYTKAEAEKRMERDRAIEAAREARRKVEEATAKAREAALLARKEKYPPDGESWVLDDFEGQSKWAVMRWANPCDVKLVKRGDSQVLEVKLKAGPQDKWALNLKLGMDMSSRSRIRMQVVNASERSAAFAIALQTNAFHESREKTVRKGDSELSYDLNAGSFKTEKSNWAHTARLAGKEYVGQMFLMIYKAKEGQTFYIDNVLATK